MNSRSTASKGVYIERESGVYDFDADYGVAHVNVTVGPPEGRTERTTKVFRTVADAGVPVFLAKLHGHEVSFAVEEERLGDVEGALKAAGLAYRSRRDLAIVTVHVGTMNDVTGIMVRIADALQLAGARMYGVGDSHSSVQCLIDGRDAQAALVQLMSAFGVEASGE
jgi:aspartokinase